MLKLIRRAMAVVLVFVMLGSLSVSALAEGKVNVTAVQDKKNGKVTLTCRLNENISSQRVTFIILRPGKTVSDIDDNNPASLLQAISYFDEKSFDEKGEAIFTFPFDKASEDGSYLIKVGGTYTSVPVDVTFEYTNFSDENKLKRINNATTAEKMRDIISEEFSALDKEGYGLLTTSEEEKFIAKLCEIAQNDGFESIAKFSECFNAYVAVGLFNSAKDKISKKTVLDSKYEVLKINSSLGVKVGIENAFMDFCEKYENTAFATDEELRTAYEDMLLNYAVKYSKWAELYDKLKALKEGGLNIDITPLNDLEGSEGRLANALQNLAGRDVVLKTFDEHLQDSIEEGQDKDSSKRPSGSSGGGGTGGAGFTSVVTNNKNEPQSDAKKEVFSDIENVLWAKEAINYLYNTNVISGKSEGVFAPNDFVKREEFVKMLVLALGENASAGADISFADVKAESWYYGYVSTAVGKGLIKGMDDKLFGAGEKLTREQLAVIISRAIGSSDDFYDLSVFSDSYEISDYAKSAVSSLYKKGIISGKGEGMFAPKDYTTRAEAAKMLYEVIKEAR